MSVLVTVHNQHWMRVEVHTALMRMSMDGRYRMRFSYPAHKPFENGLHHSVCELLKGDYEYWLTIDADNPPRRNPLDLLELDKDIIGCPTPIWHYSGKEGHRSVYWNAYNYVEEEDAYAEHQVREGLQRVDAVGTGCVLFARRVFEHPELQQGAFFRTYYPDGTVEKGNDLAFCERARALGFEIYCHFDYPCNHFSELELNEVHRASVLMGVSDG